MIFDNLINNMHQLSRNDPFTLELLQAISKELDSISKNQSDFVNEYFFDTATWYLDKYAKELNIKFASDTPIEEKRAIIEAKWKSSGKADIFLLQAIADSWKNGEIEVSFTDGKINVKFNSILGVPSDLTNLKTALETAKPAHLAILYLFKYLLIKEIHNIMTIEELSQTKLSNFAG